MFETKGDKAQWVTVYEHLQTLSIDDVVKDADLAALLPDAAESSWRSAFYRAVRELERADKRTFDRVRLVGYRMVAAAEHERLARGQHRKAGRRLKAAWSKAHSADRTQLNADDRKRIDAVELNLSQQRDMIRRLESRVERLDEDLKGARREQRTDAAVLSDRVDRLADLLQRHGITEDATEKTAN